MVKKATKPKVSKEEEEYRNSNCSDYKKVLKKNILCTACNASLKPQLAKGKPQCHPFLDTLLCDKCSNFFGDGEFSVDEDGSDKYCRWCGQGGTLYLCSKCTAGFCKKCIKRNLPRSALKDVEEDDWRCFCCDVKPLYELRGFGWAAQQLAKDLKPEKNKKDEGNSKKRKAHESDDDSDDSSSKVSKRAKSGKRNQKSKVDSGNEEEEEEVEEAKASSNKRNSRRTKADSENEEEEEEEKEAKASSKKSKDNKRKSRRSKADSESDEESSNRKSVTPKLDRKERKLYKAISLKLVDILNDSITISDKVKLKVTECQKAYGNFRIIKDLKTVEKAEKSVVNMLENVEDLCKDMKTKFKEYVEVWKADLEKIQNKDQEVNNIENGVSKEDTEDDKKIAEMSENEEDKSDNKMEVDSEDKKEDEDERNEDEKNEDDKNEDEKNEDADNEDTEQDRREDKEPEDNDKDHSDKDEHASQTHSSPTKSIDE